MAKNYPQFNENFEREGYWWLPEKPEQKIAGTLRYTPKKITLSLLGSFMDVTQMGKPIDYPIILGVSIEGEPITLHRGFQNNYRMTSGLFTETIRAISIYIGFHFQKEENIKFESIDMNLTNLDEWVGLSGFKTDLSEMHSRKTISIKYTPPKEIKCKIDDEKHLVIGFGYSMNSTSSQQKSQGFVQNTTISIESSKEILFTDFQKSITDLKNFLSLAMLEPIYQLHIIGKTQQTVTIQ